MAWAARNLISTQLRTWGSVRVSMQRAIFVHDRPWTSIKSRICWFSCFDQRPFCLLGATWAGST